MRVTGTAAGNDFFEAATAAASELPLDEIAEYMRARDWAWGIGDNAHVPTVDEIRRSLSRLIHGIGPDSLSTASGGFFVGCNATPTRCFVGIGFDYPDEDDEGPPAFYAERDYIPQAHSMKQKEQP